MLISVIELDDFGKLSVLLTHYKAEIGEDAPSDSDMEKLKNAVRQGRITFFGAVTEGRLAGCCSLVKCYSTFCFSDIGIIEDYYIDPKYRHTGLARRLIDFAAHYERLGSITVTAADCDRDMYASLGFTERLGTMLALIP